MRGNPGRGARCEEPEGNRKNPALGRGGCVAAAHPQAAVVGAALLAAGGNAVDAAVGTALALTVTEPFMSGIFGASCTLLRLASGEVFALDGYAVSPQKANETLFEPLPPSQGLFFAREELNELGHLAVGVPGTLAACGEMSRRWGLLPWKQLAEPAAALAAQGTRVSPLFRAFSEQNQEKLRRFEATRRIFLPGDRLPEVGELLVQTDYAVTLQRLAAEGPDYLYTGDLGARVVRDMKENGGLITAADLEAYRVRFREPVVGNYRGYQVHSMPQTSSGGVCLIQLLNLLEGFDLEALGFGSAEGLHLMAEAMKAVFADRYALLGDPEHTEAPVDLLISNGYAKTVRQSLNTSRAGTYNSLADKGVDRESEETTHFSAADGQGNLVVCTQTINGLFGSHVTVPGTGMLLNNTMRLFDPRPGLPNSVGPGKRMLSSMTPTVLSRGGRPVLALGVPGGTRIFNTVAQVIVNVADHGMSLQEAVEAPRTHTGTYGDGLLMESGFEERTYQELERRGHQVVRVSKVGGGMHALRNHSDGSWEGVSCWRSDGGAAALSWGAASDLAFIF